MEIQVEGETLIEATDYFRTAETLKQLGISSLIKGVAKLYEAKLASAQQTLKETTEKLARSRAECALYVEENETLRSKLARPKSGRKPDFPKASVRKAAITDDGDVDGTTRELLADAYPNGKKPHSKSETRRLSVMKKGEVENGD